MYFYDVGDEGDRLDEKLHFLGIPFEKRITRYICLFPNTIGFDYRVLGTHFENAMKISSTSKFWVRKTPGCYWIHESSKHHPNCFSFKINEEIMAGW